MPEIDPEKNPPMPEPSVGDPKTSPVSEAEVTEHGFPSTNDAASADVDPDPSEED